METVPPEQNVVTAAVFMTQLEKEGYRPFKPDVIKRERYVEQCYQKRFTDEGGTRYFINVDKMVDVPTSAGLNERYGFTFYSTFTLPNGEYFRAETVAWRVTGEFEDRRLLGEVELFFLQLWNRLGCQYSELAETD